MGCLYIRARGLGGHLQNASRRIGVRTTHDGSQLRRSGSALSRWKHTGFCLDPWWWHRKYLAIESCAASVHESDERHERQLSSELVTGRKMDRVQFRPPNQTWAQHSRMGTVAINWH